MSIVKILNNGEKYERRKFLEFVKQDLEFQSFQYQKRIHDCTTAMNSIKNQILKITKNIDNLKTGIDAIPFVEPTHSDPSTKPEIVVKSNTISNKPHFLNFTDKRIGLPRRERLKITCNICMMVCDNRIKLKQHKYEKHSL